MASKSRTYTVRVSDEQANEPTPAPRPGRLRWLRRMVAVVVAVALLGVAGVVGYLGFLNHTVSSNIKQQDLLGTDTPSPSTTTTKGQPAAPKVVKAPGQNILFLGSDARPGDTFSRSDVIVLMHINAANKKVYLIHFPRDLYVDIPGHGTNKINASYAFGGAPLLVQTLQNLVGVKIDHVAKTDFDGFKRMTDAVGGVRVYAEEASNGSGNGGPVVITQGWNNLNGEQALAFVRERYTLSEGDISRGKRQQAFIKALMLKALSKDVITNPITLAKFVNAATTNLIVDKSYSVGDMRSQAFALRSVRSADVVFVTAPFTGFAYVQGAGDVDVVDTAGMAALSEGLINDSMAQYADVSVIP